jgi:hypothetical protein
MLAVAAIAPANAQFGSSMVYHPIQSVHAAQQSLQADQLYTTALKTAQKVIVAYNLAQRMATAWSSLIWANTNMGQQFWIPSLNNPADGNLQQFINAIATSSDSGRGFSQPSREHPAHRTALRI